MVRATLAGGVSLLVTTICSTVAAASGKPDLWVEQVIVPTDPYVQQQVIVTTHLYRRSSFLSGYFVAPEAEDFRVVFVEESKPQIVFVDGREYERIDYVQAVFPQRSGDLELPGVAYSGREVFVRAGMQTITVRAAVTGGSGDWWLPAKAIALSQHWDHRPDPVRSGDILLRTLRLEGEGVMGAQLPALELPETPFWRIQRVEARTGTEVDGGQVWGWREERWRIIPVQHGNRSLPELHVTWWDLGRNSVRRTLLPAEPFSIAAGVSVAAPDQPLSPSRGENVQSDFQESPMPLLLILLVLTGWVAMMIALG